MTETDMVNQAFKRPRNYFDLDEREQWRIDKELGILDWDGPKTKEDEDSLMEYFFPKKKE